MLPLKLIPDRSKTCLITELHANNNLKTRRRVKSEDWGSQREVIRSCFALLINTTSIFRRYTK
ncbi:hypothetical protein Hanom_Chr14g01285721 [Helianthus anomalus]